MNVTHAYALATSATASDDDVITLASDVALANGVVVSPLTGTGSSAAVVAWAQALATATDGRTSTIRYSACAGGRWARDGEVISEWLAQGAECTWTAPHCPTVR